MLWMPRQGVLIMTRIESLRLLADSIVDVLLVAALCICMVCMAIYGWTT